MGIRSIAGSILAAALLAEAAVAVAGTIEGSVTLMPADRSFRGGGKPNAYVGQLSTSVERSGPVVAPDTAYGVAYVSDLTMGEDRMPEPVLLDQRGQKFVPRILAVVVGQAVDFRNSDNVFHNVFSYSPPKRFDLGRYSRGKSKRLTFQKTGLIQVFCDIHSDMRADIVVVPSRSFAYIDGEGRFRIENVPPGKHTVVVWLPLHGERAADVQVTRAGKTRLTLGVE